MALQESPIGKARQELHLLPEYSTRLSIQTFFFKEIEALPSERVRKSLFATSSLPEVLQPA
jgi:hypothetical protein